MPRKKKGNKCYRACVLWGKKLINTGINAHNICAELLKGSYEFKSNFSALPRNIRERIILENDDKSYTASETLKLCQELHIPMVFDVHHHLCNPDGLTVEQLLGPVFNTWESQSLPPKIHYSTPKSQSSMRSHADYVDSESFYEFLLKAKKLNRDFDVMLEAKNIKFIRGAVIEF